MFGTRVQCYDAREHESRQHVLHNAHECRRSREGTSELLVDPKDILADEHIVPGQHHAAYKTRQDRHCLPEKTPSYRLHGAPFDTLPGQLQMLLPPLDDLALRCCAFAL